MPAHSVWLAPKIQTWNATINSLEGNATVYSNTIFCLNEAHLVPAKVLDPAIYMLLEGVSKGRMTPHATTKPQLYWTLCGFSSGENSIETRLSSKDTMHKAGQAVRFIDIIIPANGTGVFSIVPEDKTPRELSEELQLATGANYGWAGPEFVKWLIKNRSSLDLHSLLSKIRNEMARESLPLSAQEDRVVRSFAVVALAGELAIQARILSWKKDTALAAAKNLFESWLSHQPRSESREHAQILRRFLDFYEANIDGRHFSDLKENNSSPVDERYGYWEMVDGQKMMLLNAYGLAKARGDYDEARVFAALEKVGAIYDKDKKKKAKLRPFPGGGKSRTRLYHIDPSKLENQGEPQENQGGSESDP
jgi:hypothetical protein